MHVDRHIGKPLWSFQTSWWNQFEQYWENLMSLQLHLLHLWSTQPSPLCPVTRSPHHLHLPCLSVLLSCPISLYDSWTGLIFWHLLMCTAPTPPLSKLRFNEPDPPDGLQHSSLWHLTRFMQSGAKGDFEGDRSRLGWCTSHSVWEVEAWPQHRSRVRAEAAFFKYIYF